MSASDAAPLPRLGEVFFDVRGHSRSLRLSWYADTGVAVFSIWQGGKCTGTFRLPIDDLPRMVEILQRGPENRRPRGGRSAGWEPDHSQDHRQDRQYGQDRDYGDDVGYGQDQAYGPQPGYADGPDYYQGPDYDEATHYGNDRGYSSERVVPPYVQGTGDPYSADNFSTGSRDRESFGRPAYPADRPAGPPQYDEPPWSPAGYSEEQDYR
ncbi:MAG: hypothetical protein ACLQFR_18275 [Streptosporangiaceae bacterium]